MFLAQYNPLLFAKTTNNIYSPKKSKSNKS